jgi:hypothetical protein
MNARSPRDVLSPEQPGPHEHPLDAAERAELEALERALSGAALAQQIERELVRRERAGDFARFSGEVLRAIADAEDEALLGARGSEPVEDDPELDAATLAAFEREEREAGSVAAALRVEARAEVERADWSGFQAEVLRRVEAEASEERARLEAEASSRLLEGVAGELDAIEPRFQRFGAEMQRRLDRPRAPLLRRIQDWLAKPVLVFGSRRFAGGLGVGLAAALGAVLFLGRPVPAPDEPVAEVDDLAQQKAAWAEPVSVDQVEFEEGTVTVFKGATEGVTVIWLGDET